MIRTKRLSVVALGILLTAAACENDTVNRPFANIPVDPLFERYVSMGNSITAGFQSGGITDTTQLQAYPVLLAQSMHTPFFVPLMKYPGCPPPYTNVFTGARLTPPGFPASNAGSCYLRNIPATPPPFVTNTAVPGAKVVDIYQNGAGTSSNSLTTFFLGGLTQIQMARKADPTFISLWIGNNDVLGAATSSANGGDTTLITPVAQFQTNYSAALDSIATLKPRGAILIGVANVTGIPYFSLGSTYFAIKAGAVPGVTFPATFTVSANCAPASLGGRGDLTLIPFPYGAAKLAAAGAGASNLDCADTVAAIVVPAELSRLSGAVTAYNTFIAAQATAKGWAYLDPNTTLDSLRTVATAVRPFPLIGQACNTNPFGTAFSCDAVHPSAATHRLIAIKLRDAINASYTSALPPIP